MKIDQKLLSALIAASFLAACGDPNSPYFLNATRLESAYVVPKLENVPVSEDSLTTELRKALDAKQIRVGRHTLGGAKLRSLYERRSQQLVFVTAEGLTPMAEAMKRALQEQPVAHGLLASNYWLEDMEARWSKTDVTSKVELELLLSASFIQLASDIQTGRTNPQDKSQELPDIELKKRTFNDYDTLSAALDSPAALKASFEKIEPPHLSYKVLRNVLARLNARKAQGGWKPIKFTKTLRKGDFDSNIPGIRERLYDLGVIEEYFYADNSSQQFDQNLDAAVKQFQRNFKLGADGIIGSQTFSHLAVSLDARLDQVRANLERWRLMPRELGDQYILVDLNQQMLSYVENGQLRMHMKVVVGRDDRRTPTFADRLTSIIVNPYWYAPTSIVTKDIVPKLWYDPFYLDKMKMRIFQNGREIDPYYVDWTQYSRQKPPPYTFRQDPGPHNSLGRLKFDLADNPNSIYLHDTNHPELFKNEVRLFSSGCIRVEYPRELAATLLGPQGYTQEKITQLINDPKVVARAIRLANPVKVYILGQTIAVEHDGTVRFGRDFYEQDERVIAALNGKPVPGSSARKKEAEPAPKTPAKPPMPITPPKPTYNNPYYYPPAPTPLPQKKKPGLPIFRWLF